MAAVCTAVVAMMVVVVACCVQFKTKHCRRHLHLFIVFLFIDFYTRDRLNATITDTLSLFKSWTRSIVCKFLFKYKFLCSWTWTMNYFCLYTCGSTASDNIDKFLFTVESVVSENIILATQFNLNFYNCNRNSLWQHLIPAQDVVLNFMHWTPIDNGMIEELDMSHQVMWKDWKVEID